jgi:hypothetical protein
MPCGPRSNSFRPSEASSESILRPSVGWLIPVLAAAADKEPASAAAISVFTSFQSKESGG